MWSVMQQLVVLVAVLAHAGLGASITWISGAIPNETVLVQGTGLQDVTAARLFYVSSVGEVYNETLPLSIPAARSGTSVAATLPAASGVFSVQQSRYRLDLLQNDNTSVVASISVNEPELWWMVGDISLGYDSFPSTVARVPQASRGGYIRIFGRFLAFGASGCANALRPGSHNTTVHFNHVQTGTKISIPAKNASCFEAWANLEGMPCGTYQITVSTGSQLPPPSPHQANMTQGTEGVKRMLLVEVIEAHPFPGAVYDVDAPPYSGNVTAALTAAAVGGGGTVQLGPHRYTMGDQETLLIPPSTVLQGKGSQVSVLSWDSNTQRPVAPLVSAQNCTMVSLRDLAIQSTTLTAQALQIGPNCTGATVARVSVQSSPIYTGISVQNTLRITGAQDVSVSDSVFNHSGTCDDSYILQTSVQTELSAGVALLRNEVRSGCPGFNFMDTPRMIVEGNSFFTHAPNVSLGNGAATYSSDRPVLRHLFIARNSFIGASPNASQARHETFTTDAGSGLYAGFASSCEAVDGPAGVPGFITRLRLPVNPFKLQTNWKSAVGNQFIAMNGSLAGTEAVVLGAGNDSAGFFLDLDRVLPQCPLPADATGGGTAFGVGPNRRTLHFVGNTIERGTVVQLYSMAIRNAVSHNVGHRMTDDFHSGHGGFMAWGECYSGGIQPSMYNEFEGNQLFGSNGVRVATGGTRCTKGAYKGFDVDAPFVRGIVVRNTTLQGALDPLDLDAATARTKHRGGVTQRGSGELCGWANVTGSTSDVVLEHVHASECPFGQGATGAFVDRSTVTQAVFRP